MLVWELLFGEFSLLTELGKNRKNTAKSQVSEKEACTLANAFWGEVEHLPGVESIKSAGFLTLASRLGKTKHECQLSKNLPKFGLSAGIPFDYVDLGLKSPQPILSIANFIGTLNKNSKMDIILMGNRAPEFRAFWNHWRQLQPEHEIFRSLDSEKLNWTCPIVIHCDEGTSQKKKALMIVQYHAMLGRGSRKRRSTDENPGVNFVGNSVLTRHLWSVMVARLYSKKRNKNIPLLRLMEHLGKELRNAFVNGFPCRVDGVDRQIYLAALGMKGDWPALSKIGGLVRHCGRDTPTSDSGPGICHLCRGGQSGHPWHDVSFQNMAKMRRGAPLPWKQEPGLLRPLKLQDKYKAEFFRFDLFHCCHKGLMADICANIVASGSLIMSKLLLCRLKRFTPAGMFLIVWPHTPVAHIG